MTKITAVAKEKRLKLIADKFNCFIISSDICALYG